MIKRQVANKVWINQIVKAEYVKQEGFTPNYVEIRGSKVSRVNLIATVVSKFLSEDENYGTLTLDDGTETIRAKAFGPDVMKIRNVKVGSIVTLVGKLKYYQGETYILPEVAREIKNPNWLIVRKLEIGDPIETEKKPAEIKRKQDKEEEEKEEVKTIKISPEKEQENLNQKIINLIKERDKGEGADMDKIITEMKIGEDECKNLIVGLLKSGDLFEPKKGMLKVLD